MAKREKTVTQVLVEALNLMKGGHWRYDDLEGVNDRGEATYCAMGAISKVAEGRVRNVGYKDQKVADRAARLLASVIKVPGGREQCGGVSDMIPTWNDRMKSFRPIKAGFCRAIKKSLDLDHQRQQKAGSKSAT